MRQQKEAVSSFFLWISIWNISQIEKIVNTGMVIFSHFNQEGQRNIDLTAFITAVHTLAAVERAGNG